MTERLLPVTTYRVTNPEGAAFNVSLRHSRERDTLDALIRGGATGCTFYDDPAPRWASNIHKLRCRGLIIRTEREKHGGAYRGTHARYVLLSKVEKVAGASF
jgi:hypothetical protein